LGAMLSAFPLPSSDLGTFWTLAQMRAMVIREFLQPIVRLTAAQIVTGTGGQDAAEQSHLIREFLVGHTEFLRDPDGVEMLHGPSWQLQQIHNTGIVSVDCDDVAMLAAALGKSIGLRARFVVVAFGSTRAPYQHVWTELGRGNQWLDMDVTRPAQGLPFNSISRTMTQDV
jgi:hypothetical protein